MLREITDAFAGRMRLCHADLEIEGEGAQYIDCSETPSPMHSSNSVSDAQPDVLLRMPPPHVSSDLVSTPLSTAGRALSAQSSSISASAAPGEVTELPTTTSVIQQMEGLRSIPRSHSDPHLQHTYPSLPRSTSASSTSNHQRNSSHSSNAGANNTQNAHSPSLLGNFFPVAASSHGSKKGPGGPTTPSRGPTTPSRHSAGEPRHARKQSVPDAHRAHRAHVRPATPPIDGQDAPVGASASQNGAWRLTPKHVGLPMLRHVCPIL